MYTTEAIQESSMEEVLVSLDDGEGLVLSAPGNYVLRAGTRAVVSRGVPLNDTATTTARTKWGGIVVRSSGVNVDLNGNWIRAESSAPDGFAAVVVESGAHEVTIKNGTVGRCTTFGVLVLPGSTAVTLSSLRVRDFGLGAIGFFGVPPGAEHSVSACALGPNFSSERGRGLSTTTSVVGVLIDGAAAVPTKSTTLMSVSISDVEISGLRARPRQATDLVVLGVPTGGERALSDSLGRGLERWPVGPVDGVQNIDSMIGGQQALPLSSSLCRCCCYAAATNLGNCTSPTFPKLNGLTAPSSSYSVIGLDESGAAIFGVAGVLIRNLKGPYLVSSVRVSSSSARRAAFLPMAEKKPLLSSLPVLGPSRPIFEVRSLIWAGASDARARALSSILRLTGDDGVKGPVFVGSPAHPMDAETLAHLCQTSSSSCRYNPAWVPNNSILGRPGGQSSMTLARPVGNVQNALDRLEFLPDVFLCPPTLP